MLFIIQTRWDVMAVSSSAPCLDCNGTCWCHADMKHQVDKSKKEFVTCMLDNPRLGDHVNIWHCGASHQQHHHDCNKIKDGNRVGPNNGWAYEGHLPAYLHLGFEKWIARFVDKIWIRHCTGRLPKTPHCLKKIYIRFYSPSTGWRAPAIKKVSLNDGGKATFTDDGNIELLDMREDIRIYFDPIDANQVWINVWESFHSDNNAVVNEITFYNAGILINTPQLITLLL